MHRSIPTTKMTTTLTSKSTAGQGQILLCHPPPTRSDGNRSEGRAAGSNLRSLPRQRPLTWPLAYPSSPPPSVLVRFCRPRLGLGQGPERVGYRAAPLPLLLLLPFSRNNNNDKEVRRIEAHPSRDTVAPRVATSVRVWRSIPLPPLHRPTPPPPPTPTTTTLTDTIADTIRFWVPTIPTPKPSPPASQLLPPLINPWEEVVATTFLSANIQCVRNIRGQYPVGRCRH